ncbi:STAS domain-containing protein [Amycolatopsis sp. FBCC-B4732]|uniref:STAS domain-containing protein n=1 Tax=Amycolatopsis sp. FBCC-B4732 TaxID=3079339 RepID=UPI001FF12598|nr:STAS domain-containing protein [Amycolatopsis sp. FBCC-B4732]UOX88449.1 STAS domain-containing protein [Amycolatopsis sp. FBCC-B4732]
MTAEGQVFPQDLLRVTSHRPDDGSSACVLEVTGELDLLTAPLLEEAVATAFVSTVDLLVIDLAGVSFMASVGMTILLRAQHTADPVAKVRVVAPDGSVVARTLQLTGLLEALAVVPTVSAALSR